MSLCTAGACTQEATRGERCAQHAAGMSQQEFLRGWLLLVTQPWGHRYNQTVRTGPDAGRPTADATLQMQFYFDKLKHGTPAAWYRTAEVYAQGHEWPSLENLRRTLKQFEEKPRQLRDDRPVEPQPMPEQVKALVLRMFGEPRRRFGCWIDESVPEEVTAK